MHQFEIVERYLQKMRKAYSGENHIAWDDRETIKDDVYSFFIHCNHIADWIINLNKIGLTQESVRQVIKDNHELRICADLANKSKHCKVKSDWSKSRPSLSGSQYRGNAISSEIGIKAKFSVTTLDKNGQASFLDALELAEKCFSIWNEYNKSLYDEKISHNNQLNSGC